MANSWRCSWIAVQASSAFFIPCLLCHLKAGSLHYYMLYSEKLQTDFLQMVMAVFAYIYYQSFVMVQDLSVETILEQVIWIRRVFIP